MKEWLIANPGKSVLFVTLNRNDFLAGSRLHPDIEAEFTANGIDPVRIKCFENLGSLNSEYFLRNLESLDSLRAAIEAGEETRFNVLDWIRTELIDLLQRDDWGQGIVGVDFLSAYPSKCEEPSKVQIDDVRLLPSGDVLLSFSTRLEIEVSVSFDGSDYDAHYDEMSELMGEPDGPVSDTTAWVSFESYVAVSLVLEKETLRMISSEVDELEGRHGLYEANQHPVS